ncbi:MAG: ABC transporter ATP-binding protein [Myxococcales bacterium]|nr:ABC transporter ATP-binding protein [Myxococcales bacterium]
MTSPPLLHFHDVTCRFPNGMVANQSIELAIQQGSVHALLGENGAGKSTLMKIAFGMLQPTEGSLSWKGKPISFRSASDAKACGIGMVHQHFMLVSTLRVWENMILGQEPSRLGWLDAKSAKQKVRDLAQRYGIAVDPEAYVSDLSVGQQQRVEILKALFRDIELLILDEPTAVLTPQEIDTLFESLRQLVKDGLTILFISHKLREVRALANTVTILHKGRKVDEGPIAEMDDQRITQAMVGRIPKRPHKAPRQDSPVIFEAQDLQILGSYQQQAIHDLSFSIHEGEIVGLAGVEGNGQHELIEAIVGLRPLQAGHLQLHPPSAQASNATPLAFQQSSTAQRFAAGMAYVPEDRQLHGLVMDNDVKENLFLGRQREEPFSHHGIWLDHQHIDQHARSQIKDFQIHPPQTEIAVHTLSGGNQQKVLVAREATRPAHFYVIAHPTRGVDVGAIELIHHALLDLRQKGAAILLLSSELPELLTLSDRILVLYNGRCMGLRDAQETNEQELGQLMLGISPKTP